MHWRAELRRVSVSVAGLLGVLLGLGSPAAPAEAAQRIKITQAVESLIFTPTYVARAKGFFTEEGLEVEQIATGGGGPEVQSLIAGEADFAIAGGTYHLSALQRGQKLLAVANVGDKVALNFVIHKDVAKERKISPDMPYAAKLKAMQGLTIGATRPGALTWQLAEYLIRRGGYTPQQEVKLVAAGAGPVLIAALEQRKIDILIQSIPVPETAIHRGQAIMFVNLAKGEDPDLNEFMLENVLVRPDYAEKNPDLVRRVVRAHLKANTWIADHSPEEITEAIHQYLGKFPRPVVIEALKTLKFAFPPSGLMTERALDITQDMMEKAGRLNRRFTLQEVFTAEYLK